MHAALSQLDPNAMPRLPRGVRLHRDATRGVWLLLAPETVFEVNAAAVEILRRCTGTVTLSDVVADITHASGQQPARIAQDVQALLQTLREKRLLDL